MSSGLAIHNSGCVMATLRRISKSTGSGFGFFGFDPANMPRRRRWGRTPCQNHFAMDVWSASCPNSQRAE